ncbi:MAG: hypothetical protein ACI8QS_000129 [Planctomycetota bacterium]|jgi:hypothetical protein
MNCESQPKFPRSFLDRLSRAALLLVPLVCLGSMGSTQEKTPEGEPEVDPEIEPEIELWEDPFYETFKRRATQWRDQQVAVAVDAGLNAEELAEMPLDELVEASFVNATLGEVAVYIPVSALLDVDWRTRVLGCLAALCDAQVRWREWNDDPKDKLAKAERMILNEMGVALRDQKPADVARLQITAGMDILRSLGLDEELLVDVSARPAAAPRTGPESPPEPVSSDDLEQLEEPPYSGPVRLVLLHDRVAFLEYAAAAGSSYEPLRPVFWSTPVEQWLAIDHGHTRALALSFLNVADTAGPGIPMDERNPKALEEHVTLMATRGLIDKSLGAAVEPMLAGGLATELIIDLFGEADTYTDGDTGGRSKDARSVFIPGGNPDGGILPPNSADSRWRVARGKGFFIAVLQHAQKEGAKQAGRRGGKFSNFRLISDNESEDLLVQAPFLGLGGTATVPGETFREDYVGFLRAYRTAFLHWLRTEAGGKGKRSQERFSEFLAALAKAPLDSDMAAIMESIYGMPLSSPDIEDTKSMEGQFLRWLPKAKTH